MTPEEHKQKHKELHRALDELLADFIEQTGLLPSDTSILTLVQWSYGQTIIPTGRS